MNTSYRIHLILKKLSKKEKDKLIPFLQDIIHVRRQVLSILELLLLKGQIIADEIIAEQLEINLKRIPDLKTKLYNHLETFCLYLLEERKSVLNKKMALIDFFEQRDMNDLIEWNKTKIDKLVRKNRQYLDNNTFQFYTYYKKILIHHKIHQFQREDNHLFKSIYYLDQLYWIEKMRFSCELFNRNYFLREQHDTTFFNDLQSSIPTHLKQNELLQFFYLFASFFSNELQDLVTYYPKLSNHYNSLRNDKKSTEQDIKTMAHYLLNLCLIGLKQEAVFYTEAYLNILDSLIEENILLENKYIPARLFKTAISMALLGNKLQWAEKFYINYANKISSSEQNKVIPLCKGILEFEKKVNFNIGGFDDTFYQYQKPDDLQHELGLRKLKLKLFIQAGDWEFVDTLSHQIKVFVSRKKSKLPDSHILSIKQFLHYTHSLSPIHLTKNRAQIVEQLAIDKYINPTDKKWLSNILV